MVGGNAGVGTCEAVDPPGPTVSLVAWACCCGCGGVAVADDTESTATAAAEESFSGLLEGGTNGADPVVVDGSGGFSGATLFWTGSNVGIVVVVVVGTTTAVASVVVVVVVAVVAVV